MTTKAKSSKNKGGFTVVLVSECRGKRSLKHRGWAETREEAERIWRELNAKVANATYKVLSPRQLKRLQDEIDAKKAVRKARGAKKARDTRKSRGGTRNFILCPICKAKSKKLYSEMSGLETRRCQQGHLFEFDRWIADRVFWNPAAVLAVYGPKRK